MKSTSLILALFAFVFSLPSKACLNGETKVLKNGMFIYEDHDSMVPYGHEFIDASQLHKMIYDLDSLYKKTKDIDYLSDKGYVLIVQGKYQEAIDLYLEIEKMKPNRYSTASNIGTAYELIGNNQKALEWIKKSIQIDKESHNGSEWLHVKILEAKIKGDAYITSSFLINIDFGLDEKPITNLSPEELAQLEKALVYQLRERMSFIKKQDKIVALLLFELGNVFYLENYASNAEMTYHQASKYGFSSSLFYERLTFMQNKLKKRERENTIKHTTEQIVNYWYIYLSGAILVAGILFFLLRNKFKKKD